MFTQSNFRYHTPWSTPIDGTYGTTSSTLNLNDVLEPEDDEFLREDHVSICLVSLFLDFSYLLTVILGLLRSDFDTLDVIHVSNFVHRFIFHSHLCCVTDGHFFTNR